VSFHGLSNAEGGKPNILHIEKMKTKTNRAFDKIVRDAKVHGPPGVGHYKGVERGMDVASPLPRSLSKKRH